MASIINSTTSTGLVSSADNSGELRLQTNSGNTAVTITTAQDVGIGTTTPAVKLDVTGTVVASGLNARITNTDTDASARAAMQYKTGASSNVWQTFAVNGDLVTGVAGVADYMRINSAGAMLVGTTTVYNTATTNVGFVGNVGSGISVNTTTATNGATFQVFLSTGTLIGSISNNNNTGVLYNVTSDYRLKNNAVALTGAKDFVMALKPKSWDWYNDLGKGVGFLAHEFMEVAKYSGFGEKDAVDSDGKPIYQTIQASSTEVMANIVALIQEQQTMIQELKAELDATKAEVQALKGVA